MVTSNQRAARMRLKATHSNPGRRVIRAFTLREILVAMAVFMFAIVGLLQIHIFGLRMNELVKTKMERPMELRWS